MTSPETAARWRDYCGLAMGAADNPEQEPVRLAAETAAVRHMRFPDTALADKAFKALLLQVDLYLSAPPRARPHFADLLKGLAEQAYHLIDPPPPEWMRWTGGAD